MREDFVVERSTAREALAAVSELELNRSSKVKRGGDHPRLRTRCKVQVRPGNSSDRSSQTVEATSGDVSAGGCFLLSPCPLRVGDVYWLTFDARTMPIDAVFARCVRCQLIREEAFEAGFRFFAEISLPASADLEPEDLLD